jgi:hypothetical protein
MCEFVSWIEEDGAVLFLTTNDIYNAKRGKELQKYCKNKEDYAGHGAIRFFYNIPEYGYNKECTDFSSPTNFPPEIAEAIKLGLMSFDRPYALLCDEARVEYNKTRAKALAKYEKTRNEAEKTYNEAWTKYEKTRTEALPQYEKTYDEVWTKYVKTCNTKFWALFSVKENRAKPWQ